ncbi:MAG: response regulator transcription factor [Gaiellales bacterium]
MTIRVLIVDDQALMRAGFRMILDAEADIEVVGEAADGLEAIDQAARLRPDVVVMDIRMPRLDGVEATRRLPHHRVLILTTFDLDEYVIEALRAGASGFLVKDTPPQQLVDAVRVIAIGEAMLSPAITRRLLDHVATKLEATNPDPPHERLGQLTSREVEVLRLLARGLSNAEIAVRLVVSEATVKTHISHVLSKLNVRDRAQAMVLAYDTQLVTPNSMDTPHTGT